MPRAIPHAMAANFGLLHAADQTALAAMPLIAVLVLQAGPAALGALVAAQGAAWLLVALPAGALVDRWPRRLVLALAPLGAAAGFAASALAPGGAAPLGALAFVGAGAVVLGALAGFAAVPALVGRAELPAANARLELARAVATLAGPPLAGWCAGAGAPELALLLAALMALGAGAAGLALRLPDAAPPVARPPLGRAVAEGAGFVLRHPLLRGVALCAVLFNAAFAVQLAALVPYALGPLGLSPEGAGLAAGVYGAGLIAGAMVAAPVARRVSPGALLVFGPAVPTLLFALHGLAMPLPASAGFAALAAMQLGLGFGPVLWNVTRTALQQAVTPPEMLGRVGAVMQVAVFGARPAGALLGGWLAASFGPSAAMAAAAVGLALSVVAVLGSPLPRLRAMPAAADGAA